MRKNSEQLKKSWRIHTHTFLSSNSKKIIQHRKAGKQAKSTIVNPKTWLTHINLSSIKVFLEII